MIRRTVVGCAAGAFVLFLVLTSAAPQAPEHAGPPAQPAKEGELPGLLTRVQALEEGMTDLRAALAELSLQVGTLSNSLQTHIANASDQLNGFQQSLDQFNQALSRAETDIATLEGKVTGLEATLANLAGALTSYDQLAGRPCTTALGTQGTVDLFGPGGSPTCGVVAFSANGRFLDFGTVVFDRQTSLVWEKKTTAVGSGQNVADLHDVDNGYNWVAATGAWIAAVNAEGFAGFSDWRVPTLDELLTIVDTSVATCGSDGPCIDSIFGPTRRFFYWSATQSDPSRAWAVDFRNGFSLADDLIFPYALRAVRTVP